MDLVTEQRIARRGMILAAVRQLLVAQGYEGVTVRELARVCRVSVPTLYNQFGGKDQLLAAAIEDHFRVAHASAEFASAMPGRERLLAVIDRSAQQLLDMPAYHQRLIAAFSSLGSTSHVQMRVAGAFVDLLAGELSVMQARRQLAAWVVPVHLAGQLVSACIGTAVQWSTGFIGTAQLQAAMRYAMGMVLLGALRGSTHAWFTTMVQEEQAALPTALPQAAMVDGPRQGALRDGDTLPESRAPGRRLRAAADGMRRP
jgi:AcrR family transcriptional regulator